METERKLKLKKIVMEQIGEEIHKIEFHIYDIELAYMVLGIPLDDGLIMKTEKLKSEN